MSLKNLSLAMVVLWLTACASPVSVDYDEKTDFTGLHSYAMLKPGKSQDGDVRLDNPLLAKRITEALENTLSAQGYSKTETGPDFFVTYHLRISKEIESRSSTATVGVGTYGRYGGVGMRYGYPGYEVYSYERGILTIDILSGKDKVLLWRGSTSRRLYGESTTPQQDNKLINEVVMEVLQKFPPGKEKK